MTTENENIPKLKPRVKQKWLEALRSGEYKQGREAMIDTTARGEPRYCCLGVLAKIYCDETGTSFNNFINQSSNEVPLLTKGFAKWSGIAPNEDYCNAITPGKNTDDGIYKDHVGQVSFSPEVTIGDKAKAIAEWNDSGKKFKTLADLIERQL